MKYLRLTDPLLILTMTLCLLFAPGLNRTAEASQIVAVVNGAVITDFDIAQRQRLEKLLSGNRNNLGRSAALNELIDDKLKLFEARNRSMTASDGEVTNALGNMAKNVKMSQSQLTSVFKRSGINIETVKDWLKVQISWRNLISARFDARVHLAESDIVAAINKDQNGGKDVDSATQFDLTQITFVTRAKASKSEINQKLAEAKRFRANFSSCEKDIATARNLRDVAINHIGRRDSTQLHPDMVKRLRDTKINGLTSPQKVDNGYEMLAVCGKKDLGTETTLRNEVETKLRDEQSRNLSRRYLQELRSSAVIDKR